MTEGRSPQRGVFEPEDVREMQRELEDGDRPDESEAEREDRAHEILCRKNANRTE